MAKLKTIYVCTECGTTAPKWSGKCTSCAAWNSMVEEVVEREVSPKLTSQWKEYEHLPGKTTAVLLDEISSVSEKRITTGDAELNKGLGGGLVKGSVSLLTGQPGIGKSTLMLQLALNANVDTVLYVSGEESGEQIKMRADRIHTSKKSCYLLSETRVQSILAEAVRLKTGLLIVDSVQTLFSGDLDSAPGSISQIRESAFQLIRYAKESGTPVIIIGHINKEGEIAGPKLLEHMVDTVLHFEGEKQYSYRILRVLKNRFGSTDELCIYEMQANGLRAITNPSELLLSQNEELLSGSAIAATIEGQRALLIETQALVSPAVYPSPQRVANGFDNRRMAMLLAVLEKRCGFSLAQKDVFLNVAGGIRVNDPAMDLAVVAAVISSLEDKALHKQICFAAEVGLSGEVRSVSRIESRIQEAMRIGFKAVCISKYNLKSWDPSKYKINIVPIATVDELYDKVFSKT
ncbi:MAG: DNA repair protein RadA [Saprospiraceae bacterium]|nr:DNA repair protein RadA [Saprospiraceae bacterium]